MTNDDYNRLRKLTLSAKKDLLTQLRVKLNDTHGVEREAICNIISNLEMFIKNEQITAILDQVI